MDSRYGFSAVPKWRSKGMLGIALAGALVAELFVATSAAYAAPPIEKPPAEVRSERGPDGVLQAPDLASAGTIAALEGERVEVVGERTEASTTWALPDGTFSTGLASGPIWVRRGGDGTKAGDWAAVDLTLETDSEGRVRPKAHPADLVLAGEGALEDGLLLSMQREQGESLALEWTGDLPTPELAGPRATYREVRPGVDLVVEATRTGYEQFFVLTERPGAGKAPDLSLRVRAQGLTATETAGDAVEFRDAEGQVVAGSSTPLAWDAGVDAERLHPVTEPWSAEDEPETSLAPHPDWGTPGAAQPAPPAPTAGPATADLPGRSGSPPAQADLGQAASKAAADAKASPARPLTAVAEVVAPDAVDYKLTPDEAFLQDADTQYPVVVDPEQNYTGFFDTWVQHGYSSDQSGSPELRLGTYNGGANVARSFLNLSVGAFRGKLIQSARMSLWGWHSWSCNAAAWQVWSTGQVGTGTRITAQPVWHKHWSTSTQTRGYSTACATGWVVADVTALMQAWANQGATAVGMGLKAANEADNYQWKKFNSGNAGSGLPTLYVKWNTAPTAATSIKVNGSTTGWTSDTTPQLTAIAHDVDAGARVDLTFNVYRPDGALHQSVVAADIVNGQVGGALITKALTTGWKYKVIVKSHDGVQAGPDSAAVYFTVDTAKPAAPAVTSTQYPADGEWHGDAGQSGTFTFTLPAADATIDGFEWEWNKAPVTTKKVLAVGGQTGTLTVAPPAQGRQELQVRTLDKSGNRSDPVSYVFYVGRGGLVSPREGSDVVRRVRLVPDAEPLLTHVKFEWRRGPDATDVSTIALPALTRANGRTLTSQWTALADLGGHATWDAGLTLGHVPGPVQVRAVMATDSAGTGAYNTPWVTVTVDPDADHAATAAVGPGSVNLLTGDYVLSSTDIDEFGLTLGRTASSRDPDAGLELQSELLNQSQQDMSSPLTEVFASAATATVSTTRYHTGGSSLQVQPSGTSVNSYAYPGPQSLGTIGMAAGRTYRISGWIHVPTANGLTSADPAHSLRMVAYYTKDGLTKEGGASPRATKPGMWEHLTFDYTVPVGSTNAFVRLYNGFSETTKPVFFDDLSVREIWSPLGPEWTLGTSDEIAGTAYSHIEMPYPDVARLHMSGGGELYFTGAAGNKTWWPQPGAESLNLTRIDTNNWRLTEVDGTVSDFRTQLTGKKYELIRTSPPAGSSETRLLYEKDELGRLRLDRLIAPIETGVDNWPTNQAACTTIPAAVGCEVIELEYATTTTATATSYGDVRYRLRQVLLHASEDGAAVTGVAAIRYAYDDAGRLREVWDPRISDPLKTQYDYDSAGRVLELKPPGELPWKFRYGTGGARSEVGDGDLVDRSSGRLYDVSRASLVPGTRDEAGPETTSTVVYAVPLTRAAGGPQDMDPDTLATWAQGTAPTDATAIYGPEDVPGLTTATASSPGPDGYRAATVHYLDPSGREVNTATPAGPDAPAAGYIQTSEYDQHGNVVRTLSAGNRLLALGQGATAEADLAALNLTGADTATRAKALSTYSEYGPEGIDLVRTRGPRVALAVGNDPANVQLVHDLSTYVYDQEKPDGAAYHLVTTQTDGLLVAGSEPEQLVDVLVTRNGYDPIDGASDIGSTSGWKIGVPTTVTVDAGPGGANLSAQVRFDEKGREVESRKHESTGFDASTYLAAYYTAGPNPERAECGSKPAWAGLPCVNWVAGSVAGHDETRMADTLPVETVTDYSRYGSVESVTETATGPVAGATATQGRTTKTVYDAADRVVSVQMTTTGPDVSASPMARTVNTYDPVTGHITTVSAVDPSTGSVRSTVKKSFDALGRVLRYEDANGGWTDSVYDAHGKPVETRTSLGTTTRFTYDRAAEPRGYLTSVTDSVAGTLSASYGPDGEMLQQVLPGGVALKVGYDANRTPISRTYVRTSDGGVIAASSAVVNGDGQMVTHTTPGSAKTFAYDRLRRLTDVEDAVAGSCTWRQYGYNERAGRTSMQTSVTGTSTCADPADPAAPSVSGIEYSYDSADRLVSDSATGAGGWTYDPLGRITGAPVRGSPGVAVANAYYANDLVAAQTIEGVARQSWTLDPIGRFASYVNEAWAAGGDGTPGWQEAVTKVNHYDSDSDSPAWIAEDASLPDEVTRYVDGLDGAMAVETGLAGNRVLQLVDLQGSVMTRLPIRDDEDTADWTAIAHEASDEYGNPTDLTTGATVVSDGSAPGADDRYGWHGGAQRSADALGGVLLMGVRLYDPATGRFLSPDSVPGGNATPYDYCSGDPVNCSDLTGKWGWSDIVDAVAVVGEVVATVVPGPIGAAAGAISATAYASRGNYSKAAEMAVTAAAAMVGAGAVVKGVTSARSAGQAAARIGRSRVAPAKTPMRDGARCPVNSFTPETLVVLADGSNVPIGEVEVGDFVAALDPQTGSLTAEPVLSVVVGLGEKHLVEVTTSIDGLAAFPNRSSGLPEGEQTWQATAQHPVWIEGQGWRDAGDLQVGDPMVGLQGERIVVVAVEDHGWVAGAVVVNLSVGNVHTYFVGDAAAAVLVHNCGDEAKYIPHKPNRGGEYTNQYSDRASAEAQARADAAVGGRCRYRGVCSTGTHVHVDYINTRGQIFFTRHYPFRVLKAKMG